MPKILVVDDEPEMVDILTILLKNAGYNVSKAYSGTECLTRVEKEKFDLILLDIRMPKMDGWETLRRMKKKNLVDGTKVIILTIEKGPGVEIFGLQDVVNDYLTKPFEKEKLLKSIKDAIQK
ncbi:MAG: response regulator [Candidatus Altiarchaeota archaeon]